MVLDKNSIVKYLQKNSPFFNKENQFEERPEQIQMLLAIVEAFNQKKFAFIEAGTGIGKSLAYLLPAIFSSLENNHRCVISTHTITLQEQLLQKDIPFILDSLGVELNTVLVKGMGNYLCLRKYYDMVDQASLNSPEQLDELTGLNDWIQTTEDGSSSSLEHLPQKTSWDKLNCESDACSFVKCPHYNQCFFFRARKKCKDAKLLIANHHLLLADIQTMETEGQGSILPEYEHLIIDEAHSLEDIATKSLASSISSSYLLRRLNEVVAERGHSGKIQRLNKVLSQHQDEIDSDLIDEACKNLFSEKRQVQTLLFEAFITLGEFLDSHYSHLNSNERKVSLDIKTREHSDFCTVKEHFSSLIEQLKSFSVSLSLTAEKCSEIKEASILKNLQNIIIDTNALAVFFGKVASTLRDFFNPEDIEHKVYVIEWNPEKSLSGIRMLIIQLNVSQILAEYLFSPRSSAVFCSATLSHNKSFSFIQKQLGFSSDVLKERKTTQTLLYSPFDYKKKVLLATPFDIPEPRSPNYEEALFYNIKRALLSSQGGAFILFTSYYLLQKCYEYLSNDLIKEGLLPLKQGDENRNTLLKLFKKNSNSVLFGTDTFWEGIDVPGFYLRLVIITKLPFPVPSEPIFQSKCRQIELQGKNPFMEYSVPKAIVKFKQGFGRLIRTKGDFGVILCFDSRLVQKFYGKLFINSLPNCLQSQGSIDYVMSQIDNFYEENNQWSVTESNR